MSSVRAEDVQQNYTVAGITERIKAALQASGHGDGPCSGVISSLLTSSMFAGWRQPKSLRVPCS